MGDSKRGRLVAPEPRPEGAEAFAGQWVGVIERRIVIAAPTERGLQSQLHELDDERRAKVVVGYIRPDSDSYIVGPG